MAEQNVLNFEAKVSTYIILAESEELFFFLQRSFTVKSEEKFLWRWVAVGTIKLSCMNSGCS